MPKGRIQLRLSQTALDHLEQRARAAGLTRQDFVENWLAGSQASGSTDARKPERIDVDPDKEESASQARSQRKTDRAKRKATLQTNVDVSVEGLTARIVEGHGMRGKRFVSTEKQAGEVPATDEETVGQVETRKTYCPFHRPKWCEPDCPKRVEL